MTTHETTIDQTEDQISSFRRCVLEGDWYSVLSAYEKDRDFHNIKINEIRGTTLHVAVNDGRVELVNILVAAILSHEGGEVLRDDSALKTTNERGDTPLHLAASRGFINTCKCIIGVNGERKDLIRVKNKKGETPLFRAVLTNHKKTFVYLHHLSKDLDVSLRNISGDTILQLAIWREFLDLAIIINKCYPELINTRNIEGITTLKVLANKPSAFKSGRSLSWLMQILYYCISVEALDAEKAIKSYMTKIDISEDVEHKESENEAKKACTVVEQKYANAVQFVKRVVRSALKSLDFSRLGVIGQTKKIKEKHTWSGQLLNVLMKNPYESYWEDTGNQPFLRYDGETNTDIIRQETFITQEHLEQLYTLKAKLSKKVVFLGSKPKKELDIETKETPFFAASKNGIEEIVIDLKSKIPSTVHETNCNNENVLLVAVKNRQTEVIKVLQKDELFDSLILKVNNDENTVLHLAASKTHKRERSWQIGGSAMQMMLDIKWYQYIRDLVPEHFSCVKNNNGNTPWDIFEEEHKSLLKESSEWLNQTSTSCSVVAALIAGVTFATSSTVPGGTDKGKPTLEGEPAFNAFAFASLIGLSSSVTALVIFLTILTSRKQANDFRRNLPLQLVFGLTSLFISIGSMLVSFCNADVFVLRDNYSNILFPIYGATCLPVTLYALMHFPLFFDLLKAIFSKVPKRDKRI